MTRGLKRDEQEEVFHRRLIYDGYGSGDDRRLLNIIKNVTKLCLDPDVDLKETSNIIFNDISKAIQATEKHGNQKQHFCKEIERVEKSIQSKREDIECIKSGLNALELELKFAEKLKRVTNWPDCHTTEQTMRDIEERKDNYMVKLEKQRISIKTLVEACKSLAIILEDFNVTDMN